MYDVFPASFGTNVTANVISAVGDNVSALLVVAGLAIAIPLSFYLLKRVAGLFPKGR